MLSLNSGNGGFVWNSSRTRETLDACSIRFSLSSLLVYYQGRFVTLIRNRPSKRPVEEKCLPAAERRACLCLRPSLLSLVETRRVERGRDSIKLDIELNTVLDYSTYKYIVLDFLLFLDARIRHSITVRSYREKRRSKWRSYELKFVLI